MHRRALLLALSLISSAIVQAAVARVPLKIRHLSRPLAGPRFRRRHDQVAVPDALLPYRAGHQVVHAAPCPVLTVHSPNGHV
jgi:hypothetical protein